MVHRQVASNPFSVLDDEESGDVGAEEAPPMVLHTDIPTPQTGAPTYGTSSQGPSTTIGAGKWMAFAGVEDEWGVRMGRAWGWSGMRVETTGLRPSKCAY